MAKLKATVLFDYNAEASDELTLRVGDVLTDIKQVEEGWCQGVLNGKTGVFPDNFVKIEEVKTSSKTAPPKPKTEQKIQRRLKVAFAYDPQNEDELKLSVDDVVVVLKDEEEGWARGLLNGQEGVFPTNFCVPIANGSSAAPTAAAAENHEIEEPVNQIPAKKVKGVGFGNIFGDGPIKLKKSSHTDTDRKTLKSPTDKKPKPAVDKKAQQQVKPKTEKVPPPTAVGKKSKTVEKYRATFDYTAEGNDELTLAKGDIIVVTNKNCEDAGWWEGEITDRDGTKRRGLFPDNFVELLPSKDEEARDRVISKDSPDTKAQDSKVKSKQAVQEPAESKTKPAVKASSSLKRPAPLVPLPTSKVHVEEADGSAASDLAAVTTSTPDEQQLTHYKRPVGPKNRRKPDVAGRRERAKDSADEPATLATTDVLDAAPMPVETDATPQPVQDAPKRDASRGIQVMPTPASGGDGGEKPAWLKNLKNRTSQKRESGSFALPLNKPEDVSKETPDWLSNLRKKSKSGEKATSPVGHKPTTPTSVTPKPTRQAERLSSPPTLATADSSHERPSSPDKALESRNEKSWSFKKITKRQSESDVSANASVEPTEVTKAEQKSASETKKTASRPAVALQPPKPVDAPKKAFSIPPKPRPPPPKSKPALPSSKPSASSSVEEIREELKSLKENVMNYQAESSKEISRLKSDLEEERKQRIRLEVDVAQLRKDLG